VCGVEVVGGQDDQLGGVLLQCADLRVAGEQLFGVVAHGRDLVTLQELFVVGEVTDQQQRWRNYLLSGPDGLRLAYETWRNRLAAAARATGNPDITTHVLRHTAASLRIKAGATPLLVMKAGGWASLDTVSSVYGYLWPSDVVELGRKVDALDWEALD